jgi:hypothetical protein
MAASGVVKCIAGLGAGVVEPGTADDRGDDGGDDGTNGGADRGADDGVRGGGVAAGGVGAGVTSLVGAAVAGLDRASPQPAVAKATVRPAATPSNERCADANAVDFIGRPLSAGSGAARKGRLK